MQLGWGQHLTSMISGGEEDEKPGYPAHFSLLIGSATFANFNDKAVAIQTYDWIGLSSASWGEPSNWNPPRETPAETDILRFRVGHPRIISNVPNERVGQILVTGNTFITLTFLSTKTLTVSGDIGDDLVVESGSQLNITGANGLTIALEQEATGVIGGSMEFTSGAQRLTAADANGIFFQAGSCFTAGVGFTGNPFGKTSSNSVIFQAGSCYLSKTGEDPFALLSPESVIVFQTGSLYKLTTDIAPKFSGRTFADIEIDAPMKTIWPFGNEPFSIDNLTITNGTLNLKFAGAGGHSIKGNISVASGATLNFSPTSSGTIFFNGSSQQTISGAGAISSNTLTTLELQNTAGVVFDADAELSGGLTISAGFMTLQSGRNLTIMGTLATGGLAEELIIKPGGSLIFLTAGVNAMIERSIVAWGEGRNGWHLLSSPVGAQEINTTGGFVTSGPGNDYDFFSWSEPHSLWVNFKNSTVSPTFTEVNGGTDAFRTGRGYMVAYEQSSVKQFKGSMNVANVMISGLTMTDVTATQAWHLLGNPYPSALLWDNSWERSNVGAVCQVWNETLNDYSAIQNGPIPAMNGFMVEVSGANASVRIPVGKRMHSNQGWYKSADESSLKLTVMAADSASGKETVVRFSQTGTAGFDPSSDGHFLKGNGPVFCSLAGEDWLSINTLPALLQPVEVPLIFVKNESDAYILEVRGLETIQEDVILCDLKTGNKQNLSIDSVYAFTASDTDSPLRFKLSVGGVGIDAPSDRRLNIFTSGKKLHIRDAGGSLVEIVNMEGQVLVRFVIHDEPDYCQSLDLPDGVYAVRIVAGDSVVSKCVVIY
ncbi:MAG TPA: hypothetical protein DEO70_03100 [Bacteroidales bacterium]|nr:MAG: hypothetical protein A2X11_01910 [Bacteroidetes bacterium GWE2_42_24]HBZ65798.1 hypothetical protein [Bacteroidales bacterium]